MKIKLLRSNINLEIMLETIVLVVPIILKIKLFLKKIYKIKLGLNKRKQWSVKN
jgi:hypothetical protein